MSQVRSKGQRSSDHSADLIRNLRFTPCASDDRERGHLGYVAFDYGSVRLDSIALRRTRRGHLELSYPERSRGSGKRFPIVCPVNDAARVGLESAVLEAIYPRLVELGLAGAQ